MTVASLAVEVLKTRLGVALSSHCSCPSPKKGTGLDPLQRCLPTLAFQWDLSPTKLVEDRATVLS